MRIAVSSVAVIALATLANVPRESFGALQSKGYVVAPTEGEPLVYCGRPLLLKIKVDARRAPGTRLIAGTAELRGDEGAATHREGDEVLYVVRGSGHAILGNTRVPLEAGSLAFIPQGISLTP